MLLLLNRWPCKKCKWSSPKKSWVPVVEEFSSLPKVYPVPRYLSLIIAFCWPYFYPNTITCSSGSGWKLEFRTMCSVDLSPCKFNVLRRLLLVKLSFEARFRCYLLKLRAFPDLSMTITGLMNSWIRSSELSSWNFILCFFFVGTNLWWMGTLCFCKLSIIC